MRKDLNSKEKAFCYYFVETGNANKAFSISKINNKKLSIPKLMINEFVQEEIKKIYENKKKILSMKAEIGYERLAFGDIADCIKLMFIKDLEDKKIEKMDLFNISEVKRLKDGTVEIKFFDRIKAMEKLEQIESIKSDEGILPFYSAVENGIKGLVKKNVAS